MDVHTDHNHGNRSLSPWRIAAWGGAALLLLVPVIAMQFTDQVQWSAGDFVFAGVLLFGSLGAYEAAVRTTGSTSYRAGVGVAVAATFLLLWSNGAVGITDGPADLLFFLLVPAVALVGVLMARFRPRGMALAMFATALVVVLIGVIALVAGVVPAFNPAFVVLGITAFFAVLFAGSALLFRQAADATTADGASSP